MQISAYLGAKRRLQTTSVRQIFAPLGTFIDINANKDPFPLSVFRSISLMPFPLVIHVYLSLFLTPSCFSLLTNLYLKLGTGIYSRMQFRAI